jgi:chromosome segregation ATPase
MVKKGDTAEQKNSADARAVEYAAETQAAQKEIDVMKDQLDQAQRDVARAQSEVDQLNRLPPIHEPSEWEGAMMAQKVVRSTDAPKIG